MTRQRILRGASALALTTTLAAAGCATSHAYGSGGVSGTSSTSGAPAASRVPNDPNAKQWIQLFNGRDLNDWQIKFAKHDLGDNFNDTFRVENGMLEVRYDKWTKFDGEFGHIFYKRPFSYYLVAAEYRFVGHQAPGAESLAWANRNNGIMIMGQSAESMGHDQDFPMSLEVQLLGGLSDGKPRPTGNLCTPGTNVHFGDTLITRHCTNSTSKTYDGDVWVRVEALVLGDSIIKHIVEGDTVLVYRKPEMGGGAANNMKPGVKVDGTPISSGTISLQAETAPIDFRKVELLDLEGCTDPKASNYKRYFVKSDPASCTYAGARP